MYWDLTSSTFMEVKLFLENLQNNDNYSLQVR